MYSIEIYQGFTTKKYLISKLIKTNNPIIRWIYLRFSNNILASINAFS